MNNEVEWNTQVTKIHHTRYVRNTRAITVAWFVFCACYTILNIVAFIQPFWFGDTNESPGVGYFGVYEWCERVQGSDYRCEGDFLDFNTIKNDYFRATSFLVGLPILLFMLSIICMLLFLFLKARIVLRMCGTLQLVAGEIITSQLLQNTVSVVKNIHICRSNFLVKYRLNFHFCETVHV